MNVLILIVNYRSTDLAIDCLRSLEPEVRAVANCRTVVVENASGDDSADRLAAAIAENGWGGWVELVNAPRNGGFSAGNNLVLAPALASPSRPDYIWLLNPDTVIRPGALTELIGFFQRRPDVGLAGSRLEHPDGEGQRSAFRFPTVLGELEGGLSLGLASRVLERHVVAPPVPTGECRVDWVAGASLLIRREVFEVIGLLDEGYFMYFEDVDFCLKANRAGWPCWYVPTSRVVHLVGRSSGVTNVGDRRKRRPRYWFEARKRFFRDNYGRARTLLANLAFATAYASYRTRRRLQRKPDIDPQGLLWDFVRYNFLPVKR